MEHVNAYSIYSSVQPVEPNLSVQGFDEATSLLWAARCEAEVDGERQSSDVATQEISMELEVESVSVVPAEYRTAYVLATHPTTATSGRAVSDVDKLPPSAESNGVDVSSVPAEGRTTKVRRIL